MVNSEMAEQNDQTEQTQDEHALIAQRRAKLAALRVQGRAFPTDFRRNVVAGELHAEYGDKDADYLEAHPLRVKVAGRMMAKRLMGKASFTQLLDMSGRIQLFNQRDVLPGGPYEEFMGWDVGDIIGAEGVLFRSMTGELSGGGGGRRRRAGARRPRPGGGRGRS